MKALWIGAIVVATAATLSATQFSYNNTGGTVSQTTDLTISGANLSNPAGTVSMSCPLTYLTPQYPYLEEWTCTGGSVSAQSSDGTTSVTGSFTSGIFTLRRTTSHGVSYYYYALYANFSGSQVINGKSTAVLGAVSETLAVLNDYLNPLTGTIQTGLIDISQEYEPVYIADTGNNRIVQSADMLGSNWTSLGKAGSGAKQFSQPWGVAVDSLGKIYVTDSGNCRIVRMANMTGANWTSFGSCGSGTGQFSSPKGLSVDSSGKIYIADSGNNRIVRVDNVTGTNFTAFGTRGNGTGQFSNPSAVATDSAGNIYVADNANARIVEFADMIGTNWVVLQFPLGYLTPDGIALDSANKIYLTDSLQSQVIRTDNIAGANTVSLNVDYANYSYDVSHPTGLFVDPDGAIYVADTGNSRVLRFFDLSFNDVFSLGISGKGIGNLSQPHGAVAVPVSKTVSVASVTPPSLTFPTTVLGSSPGPAESTVLTNIGSKPFNVASVISSSADFPQTHNCPATLAGGQFCSASVTFQPTTSGHRKGSLTFKLTGASSKSVPLTGDAALVVLNPTYLILYDGGGGTVTVTNPQSSTIAVKSVAIAGAFSQTNNCGTLAPGASCSIIVSWGGGGVQLGYITVIDSSGIPQYVGITGE